MTKTDVKKQLEATTGKSFLNISEIARCLGSGRDYARELVNGLGCLESGREKRYLVSDVAGRIVERQCTG